MTAIWKMRDRCFADDDGGQTEIELQLRTIEPRREWSCGGDGDGHRDFAFALRQQRHVRYRSFTGDCARRVEQLQRSLGTDGAAPGVLESRDDVDAGIRRPHAHVDELGGGRTGSGVDVNQRCDTGS